MNRNIQSIFFFNVCECAFCKFQSSSSVTDLIIFSSIDGMSSSLVSLVLPIS